MNERVLILRDAVVKITQMLSGKGITVTQRGVNAYVKCDHKGRPTQVNLPYLPDNATEELCLAIQGFLDHEVAHILFSDFTLLDVAAKAGCQSMLNMLEDARIEREMAKRFSGSGHNLSVTGKFFLDKYTTPMMQEAAAAGDANKVIGVLMVPLIRAMAGQFVFQEFMKDKMHIIQAVYDKIADLEPKIQAAASTHDCLELAKEIESRLRSGGKGGGMKKSSSKGGDGDASDDEVKSVKGKAKSDDENEGKPKKQPKKSKADSEEDEKDEKEETAPKKADNERDEGKKPDDEEGEGEKADDSDEGEGEGATGEEKGEEEKKDEGEGKSAGEEDEGEGADDKAGPGDDDEDEGEGASASGEEEGEDEDEGDSGDPADTDPEADDLEMEDGSSEAVWEAIDKENANGFDKNMSIMISESAADAARHSDYLVYTKDADKIEPLYVGSGYDSRMLADLADKVDHMVGPLQKDLERAIAARSLATWEAGRRSGRLHSANLSRLAVGDARVFRKKHETTSKDVAVELVIDASGSMNGSKIHLATQSAYALSSVLERIGIQHEVICFTTGEPCADSGTLEAEQRKIGRAFTRIESLYMPVIKGFNERLRTEVKERFGWLPNSRILRNNIDGECVEIAARRLLSRREAGKVMIVLSDGMPNAYGDTHTLRRHLKKVVQNVAKQGVKVVGIGIQTSAVEQFYPKSCVIHNVAELPERVVKELRHLLIS